MAAAIGGGIAYLVLSAEEESREELVATESRDSSESPDTAVQPAEERQIEVQGPEVEEVVTTPTTSPPTTTPEAEEPEDVQETGTEEESEEETIEDPEGDTEDGEPEDESEVPTSPASQNVFGNGEGLILVEAYSLGCPACAEYHPILKQIREEYKDQITFQAVHFPLAVTLGGNTRAAHQAVEAAAKQGKFWQMHDILFENRDWTSNQPFPQLKTLAEEAGLDLEQFEQDFYSAEIGDIIDADERYLLSLGVSSTPTFFLNSQQIVSNKLAGVELARQTLNEVLGIEPEKEAVKEPEEGTESGKPEVEPEEEAVKEPEEGTESGKPEVEPEEEAEAIPDPIIPNEAWLALMEKKEALGKECGYFDEDRGGYLTCEDPEDTQEMIRMISAAHGCEFNHDRGACRGMDWWETAWSEDRQACPDGWGLPEQPNVTIGEYTGWACYRYDHPDYPG